MKIQSGGGIAPCIHNHGNRWKWMKIVMSFFLPWAKSLQYPMQRELGKPQSRFGHSGENKISFHYWESNRNSMVVQLSWYSDYSHYTNWATLVHTAANKFVSRYKWTNKKLVPVYFLHKFGKKMHINSIVCLPSNQKMNKNFLTIS